MMTRYIFLIITAGLFFYSKDLVQKNKEEIFLNAFDQKQYNELKEKIPSAETLFILNKKNSFNEIKKICDDECEILEKRKIPESFSNIFNLLDSSLLILSNDISKMKNISSYLYKNKIQHIGGPFVNILLDNYSIQINNFLFPLVFLGIFLTIFSLTRRLSLSIDLFLPIVFSATLTNSIIKFFYGHGNLIISITPLLLAVLNFSLCLHLYFTTTQTNSIKKTIQQKFKPILMMASTTFIGLLSLYLSKINVIRDFGLLSSISLFLTYAVTIFYLKKINLTVNSNLTKSKFQRITKPFKSKVVIFSSSILLGFLGVYYFYKLPIITEATKYFLNDPSIRKNFIEFGQKYIGMPTLEIVLNTQNPNLETLKNISPLEAEMELIIKKYKAKLISGNIVVKKINSAYSGKEELPNNLIAYQSLLSKFSSNLDNNFYNESLYKIIILSAPMDEQIYDKMISELSFLLKKRKVDYFFSGIHYYLTMAQKEMIFTLIKSFLFSLIVISLISAIWLKSFNTFLLFTYINTLPILISLPILYFLGGSLNIATVMTYSISLGLIVDSSFHLIHDIKQKTSYSIIFQQTKRPIIYSCLSLIILFSLFGFIPFLPIKEFGLNLSILIFLGLVFDLKILPTLLNYSRDEDR